jgi:RNA polymerase sigma factor (sigma-70 family)
MAKCEISFICRCLQASAFAFQKSHTLPLFYVYYNRTIILASLINKVLGVNKDDSYIITECINGNESAFGFLVDKYKSSVYALAYSMLGNFHDAEDVAQESFLKAYRRLHLLKQLKSFPSWLYSITSNTCKDFIRLKVKSPDSDYIEEQKINIESESVRNYKNNLVNELIRDSVNSLSDIYREVITLYYMGDMNSREIAEFLNITPETARWRLSRARKLLKADILAMTDKSLRQHRLQPDFTFKIIELVKNMTGPRYALGVSSVDNNIYAIGGVKVHWVALKTNEEYDILTQCWTKKTDLPTARLFLSTSTVNGKIYAIGGLESHDNLVASSVVEEYDPETDKWTRKSNMPTPRASISTAVYKKKIYVIGGVGKEKKYPLSIVEEYDPANDAWTKKSDMIFARANLAAVSLNGKIYAIGGQINKWGPENGDFTSVLEEYDPLTDTWKQLSNMSTARALFSANVVDGKIYVLGGVNREYRHLAISTVEEYDSHTDKWTKKPDMLTARYGFGSTVINKKIYAVGGSDDAVGYMSISTLEEYDPIKKG